MNFTDCAVLFIYYSIGGEERGYLCSGIQLTINLRLRMTVGNNGFAWVIKHNNTIT